MEEGKALETSKRQSRGEMGREGKRRRGSLNFMLLSLSLLLRPAARGIREDVTFILQQFPILSLPLSLPPFQVPSISPYSSTAAGGYLDLSVRLSSLAGCTAAEEETVPLSDSKFRFLRYQDITATASEHENCSEGLEWRARAGTGAGLPNLFIF